MKHLPRVASVGQSGRWWQVIVGSPLLLPGFYPPGHTYALVRGSYPAAHPSDIPSPVCPCRRLVVVGVRNLDISGTPTGDCTASAHTHVGRTQPHGVRGPPARRPSLTLGRSCGALCISILEDLAEGGYSEPFLVFRECTRDLIRAD